MSSFQGILSGSGGAGISNQLLQSGRQQQDPFAGGLDAIARMTPAMIQAQAIAKQREADARKTETETYIAQSQQKNLEKLVNGIKGTNEILGNAIGAGLVENQALVNALQNEDQINNAINVGTMNPGAFAPPGVEEAGVISHIRANKGDLKATLDQVKSIQDKSVQTALGKDSDLILDASQIFQVMMTPGSPSNQALTNTVDEAALPYVAADQFLETLEKAGASPTTLNYFRGNFAEMQAQSMFNADGLQGLSNKTHKALIEIEQEKAKVEKTQSETLKNAAQADYLKSGGTLKEAQAVLQGEKVETEKTKQTLNKAKAAKTETGDGSAAKEEAKLKKEAQSRLDKLKSERRKIQTTQAKVRDSFTGGTDSSEYQVTQRQLQEVEDEISTLEDYIGVSKQKTDALEASIASKEPKQQKLKQETQKQQTTGGTAGAIMQMLQGLRTGDPRNR